MHIFSLNPSATFIFCRNPEAFKSTCHLHIVAATIFCAKPILMNKQHINTWSQWHLWRTKMCITNRAPQLCGWLPVLDFYIHWFYSCLQTQFKTQQIKLHPPPHKAHPAVTLFPSLRQSLTLGPRKIRLSLGFIGCWSLWALVPMEHKQLIPWIILLAHKMNVSIVHK